MELAASQEPNDGLVQYLPTTLQPVPQPTMVIINEFLEDVCLGNMNDYPDSRLLGEGPLLVAELDWAWGGRFWDPYYRRMAEYPGWRYPATDTPHFAQAVACMTRLTRKCLVLNFPLNLLYEEGGIMHTASLRFFNCFHYTLTPRVVNAAYDLLVSRYPTRLQDQPPIDSNSDIPIELIQRMLELQQDLQNE